MKINLVVPSLGYKQNRALYKKIQESIIPRGHELYLPVDDELIVESAGRNGMLDSDDWAILCRRELEAVKNCDAVIADITNKSTFGVGYLAAIALQHNKPTLFLMHEGSLEGSFISGLQHPMLTRATFTEATADKAVGQFLRGEY